MRIEYKELQELSNEHWDVQEKDGFSCICSGEYIVVISNDKNLKQQERLQLASKVPEMTKALIGIIDKTSLIIMNSKDQTALDALHDAYHVLKDSMGQYE